MTPAPYPPVDGTQPCSEVGADVTRREWFDGLTDDERGLLSDPISQVLFGDAEYAQWFRENVGKPAGQQVPWHGTATA